MGGFNNTKEGRLRAKLAGQKSKRPKSILTEEIREKIKDGIDIDRLMKNLNQMEGKELIQGASQLMNFFLPKMSHLDVQSNSVAQSLVEFQQMSEEDQTETLKEVARIKREKK